MLPRLLLVCVAFYAQFNQAQEKSAYFGDLHVHTSFSFDAFQFGTRTTPDDAYNFASGKSIKHPSGEDMKLDTPLDFFSVTDHAAYLGFLKSLLEQDNPLFNESYVKELVDTGTVKQRGTYLAGSNDYAEQHMRPEIAASAWQEIISAAERHNNPGTLTTFIGYEYTPSREGGNLHRNVIFKSKKVPQEIFSRLDSANPEDLWTWMDEVRAQGMESLSIPHNSNGSDGWMFQMEQFDGTKFDSNYAEKRMRNEPLVEITQVKGTSETHPFLSPDDDWAGFEIFPYRIAQFAKSRPQGSYVREALKNGVTLNSMRGFNPYQFGFVGASDTHNSGFTFDEEFFSGKVGIWDFYPKSRGSVPTGKYESAPTYRETYRRYYSSSGLTGVWAEKNTRASIYSAFARKETFATSGPRIRIRLFAGNNFSKDSHLDQKREELGYERGVSMGGKLEGRSDNLSFIAMATQDPKGIPLQRLQMIKGWVENGVPQEKVFDIACSNNLKVDKSTHRCPENGAKVNLADCSISANSGSSELSTTWSDPEFNPKQEAFYYLRALENPSCRWSTWDAIRAGEDPRVTLNAIIQERAWSSPVWYSPQS